MENQDVLLKPIGFFHSNQVHPYEAGRQTDEHSSEGEIELRPGENFEQALTGIEGCSHIWLIFGFHRNNHWNPMVLPPRGPKMGVFATRSPYRPNPLGLSCVKLNARKGLRLVVESADLLDGTPIYDIKPYLAYADSFPGVEPKWLPDSPAFEIFFDNTAEVQLKFLKEHGVTQFESFIYHQLEYEPTNHKKKRVQVFEESCVLAYRTWRAEFEIIENKIDIKKIFSGYSDEDLLLNEDPYEDKKIHREFKKLFPDLL